MTIETNCIITVLALLFLCRTTLSDNVYLVKFDMGMSWDNPTIWSPHVPTVADSVTISVNNSFNENDVVRIDYSGVANFKSLVIESAIATVKIDIYVNNPDNITISKNCHLIIRSSDENTIKYLDINSKADVGTKGQFIIENLKLVNSSLKIEDNVKILKTFQWIGSSSIESPGPTNVILNSTCVTTINADFYYSSISECFFENVIVENNGIINSINNNNSTINFCTPIINLGTWNHISSGKLHLINGLVNNGILNVISGNFILTSSMSEHNGNFNISTIDPLTFQGIHVFHGKAAGPLQFITGNFTISSQNFSQNWSAKGPNSFISINSAAPLSYHETVTLYLDSVLTIISPTVIRDFTVLGNSEVNLLNTLTVSNNFYWRNGYIYGSQPLFVDNNCIATWINSQAEENLDISIMGQVDYYLWTTPILARLTITGTMYAIVNQTMTWSNKHISVEFGGTLSAFLGNSSQVLTILGNLTNDGIVNVYSGSLVLHTESSMSHRGNFIYDLQSSLKFQGNHTITVFSRVQGGPNVTFTNGRIDFEGEFTGITGYTHGPTSLVVFHNNVTFDYPMVVSSGGIRLLGLSISFQKGLTLSARLATSLNEINIYENFNVLVGGNIIGDGTLNLYNTTKVTTSSITANSLTINNYGLLIISYPTNFTMSISSFNNHNDFLLENGNLILQSGGIHTGQFRCNVTTNSIVQILGINYFSNTSRYFGNKVEAFNIVSFTGIVGIRDLEIYNIFYMDNPYRTNGTVNIYNGATEFHSDVTINTLNVFDASVHFYSQNNHFKNFRMIGSSVTDFFLGIYTEVGSLIIVDSSLVLYGNPQIVRMRGLGRLIISNQTVTNISNAHIHMAVDNYSTFNLKGIFQVNSSFINHNIGVLKIDSQETNITSQDQGKIINYGSFVFFSLNVSSPSTITIATDIINYGSVDVKFDYWELSQKNYIQFSGETSFININAESIEHYGGGFHGYETLSTKLGYDYYQGAIFPGGQNKTGSLTIIGDFNILNFSCVIEFDIDSNNLNDVIYLDNPSATQILDGTFQINNDRNLYENYTLIEATSLLNDSSVHLYAYVGIYDKIVTSNIFGIEPQIFIPDESCGDCSTASSYCLEGGFCQCYEGIPNTCPCSLGNCQCNDPSECQCPPDSIGTPFCQVVFPPFPLIGCTDEDAINYNPNAQIDDYSCHYNLTTTVPTTTGSLSTGVTTEVVSLTTGAPTTISSEVTGRSEIIEPSSNGISAGGIAGIVLGLIAFIAIIAILLIFLLRRRKSKSSKLEDSETPDNVAMVQVEKSKIQSMKNIQVFERLGGGNYGDVYRGTWNVTPVALKKLKSEEQMQEFFKEADILHELRHKNIVQFFGIYINENNEQFMVTEYMAKGSLTQLFTSDEKSQITTGDLIAMSLDCAAGMAYLHDRNIIHCDLALRNLLVSSSSDRKYLVKVADFGMSKTISNSGLYSRVDDNGALPIKWTAIEVLEFGKYSFSSDVWSFGVVLYELFSWGKIPYSGWTNKETIEYLKKGQRLEKPEECPSEIYEIMVKCWEEEPSKRPSFEELCQEIMKILSRYDKIEGKVEEPRIELLQDSGNVEPVYN